MSAATSDQGLDLAYIQTTGVGKVIAMGLGQMYRKQPKFPVHFLASWLENYSQKQEYIASLEENDNKQEQHHRIFVQQREELAKQEEDKKVQKAHEDEKLQKVKDEISKTTNHEKMIESMLADELMSRIDLTGVYIGLYEFPIVPVSEDNDEDLAHLNMNSQKVIQYVGGDAKSMVEVKLRRNF
jgi:hypothetical protein